MRTDNHSDFLYKSVRHFGMPAQTAWYSLKKRRCLLGCAADSIVDQPKIARLTSYTEIKIATDISAYDAIAVFSK